MIGGEGYNYLSGGVGADRYILDHDGVDLIDTSWGLGEFENQTDLIELPDDVTFADISTEFGQTQFGVNSVGSIGIIGVGGVVGGIGVGGDGGSAPSNIVSTLNILWDGKVRAMVMLPESSDNVDHVALKFADGRQVSLEELIANTSVDTGLQNDMVVVARNDGDTPSWLAPAWNLPSEYVGGDGNDTLTGSDAADTLAGNAGEDMLSGSFGDDTYIFNLGDGVDRIQDTALPGEGNTLEFGEGITPDSITLDLGSLLLRIGNGGDAIHLENFDPADALGTHAIENFRFADGTVLTYAELLAKGFDIRGGQGDDILTGTNLDNRIDGGGGNDVLTGSGMSDVLTGGVGDDTLVGGSGMETFVFNAGDGHDTIIDSVKAVRDIIRFGADVMADSIQIVRQGEDLVVAYGSAGDSVRIRNFRPDGAAGEQVIEHLYFSGGDSMVFDADDLGNSALEHYAEDGALLSRQWTAADNTHGTMTFNTDGSTVNVVYAATGEHTRISVDAGGLTRIDSFSADGSMLSSEWRDGEGNFGSDIYYADGSHSGTETRVDGTYITSWHNADGSYSSTTSLFDGTKIEAWHAADGSSGALTTLTGGTTVSEWRAASGESSKTIHSPDGSTQTESFAADGRKTYVTWRYADGSYGSETFNIDGSYGSEVNGNYGSKTATWHNADGSYSLTMIQADGSSVSEWHATAGDFSRTTIGADSSAQTDYFAADGRKTSDTWRHPDGSYGSDAFNADGSSHSESHYPNGSTTIVIHAVDGSVQNTWLNADGSSSSQTVFADSSRFNTWHNADGSEGAQTFDANWNMTADSWRSANGLQGVNAGGNHLLLGTSGNESLWPASGSQILIGGAGDDIIATSWSGNNVVSFNEGDGHDILYAGGGDSNTLSLGGRFAYDNLRLLKNGNDLVLQMGADDAMTFKEWYGWSGNRNIDTLQVIAEAMADFDTSGSDVLRDDKVETFDFAGVVDSFDQARAADATLDSWAITDALLDFHLFGSDVDAIGGDLAYQYGMNGTLSGVGLNAAQSVIAASQFGQTTQSLNSPTTWQAESVRLG